MLFKNRKYPSWIDSIKELGSDSKGKKEYVELMRRRYDGDIDKWNKVYDPKFKSFDDIYEYRDFSIHNTNDKEAYKEDDLEFLRLITRRYCKVIHDCIKEFDPNHLILGDRYDGDAGIPDVVLEEAGKYIDVMSTEYYQYDPMEEHLANIEKFHRLTGKTVLLCDSCYAVPTEGMPGIIGPLCPDRDALGRRYREYFNNVLSLPYVIGWHWCGFIDSLESNEAPHQHPGLKDAYDNPYEEELRYIIECNKRLYSCVLNRGRK